MGTRNTANRSAKYRLRRAPLGFALAALTVVVPLAAGLAPPASAAAASPKAPVPVTFQVKTQVPSETVSKPGQVTPLDTVAIIITCIIQENYPHNSSHVNGVVNVVGTATCDYPVTTIDLVQNLYYNGRKWAYGYTYQTPGGTFAQATAATPCQNGNYQGVMQYWITWPPNSTPAASSGQVASPVVPIIC